MMYSSACGNFRKREILRGRIGRIRKKEDKECLYGEREICDRWDGSVFAFEEKNMVYRTLDFWLRG